MPKPELAFDVCWEVYRGAREVLETKRGISALDPTSASDFLWRPSLRPKLTEYVADFSLAGQRVLEGPQLASRLVVFRMYYLGLAPYESARRFLGISELSWAQWTVQIRCRVGGEILRRRLFPPRSYFKEAS
jgi:hypothetical protein